MITSEYLFDIVSDLDHEQQLELMQSAKEDAAELGLRIMETAHCELEDAVDDRKICGECLDSGTITYPHDVTLAETVEGYPQRYKAKWCPECNIEL